MTVEELKSIAPEELFGLLKPLLTRSVFRSHVPGFEHDDKMQELLLRIWRCQQNYDPTKVGHNGKPSSFINYVIHAISNCLGNLDYYGRRQRHVVVSLECEGCGAPGRLHRAPGDKKCASCGGGRWKSVYGNQIGSVDKLAEAGDFWQPTASDEYDGEATDLVDRIVDRLPAAHRAEARAALYRVVLDIPVVSQNGKVKPTQLPVKLQRLIREHVAGSGIFQETLQ